MTLFNFLNIINKKENLQFSMNTIQLIQKIFNSDIRSMINYMQSNEQIIHDKKIIQDDLWNKMTENIKNATLDVNLQFIRETSNEYNIEKKNIVKNYLNYIIRTHKYIIIPEFLHFVENIMHIPDLSIDCMLPHTILKLNKFLTHDKS